MQTKSQTEATKHAADMDQPAPRGHGCGLNLVAFALIAGIAYRRTRLEDGAIVIDAWEAERGGWHPMRQELRVEEQNLANGTRYIETLSYPEPLASFVGEDDPVWGPTLPDRIMVDVLRAQVDRLRERLQTGERELDDLRGHLRGAQAELAELRAKHERAMVDHLRALCAVEAERDEAKDAHHKTLAILGDETAARKARLREALEWETRHAHVTTLLKDARLHLAQARHVARRIARLQDAAESRKLARELLRDTLTEESCAEVGG